MTSSTPSFLGFGDGDPGASLLFGETTFGFGPEKVNSFFHTNVGDEIFSVNGLHKAFASAIINMPSRLQLFEVMDEWMIFIERALSVDRHLNADIPDEVYDRLLQMLKKEYETWDLIKTLYYERLNVQEEQKDRVPFEEEINDRFRLDEMIYGTKIVQGDKSLREMDLIISWLELNYSRLGDPDLTQKCVAWEQTLDELKRDKILGKSGGSMVSTIDPDAPYRERKELHPLDAAEELRTQRGTFHYLRQGNFPKAINFLHQSGHIAKAKALLGSVMSEKGITEERVPETQSDDGSSRRPRLNFNVTGNPQRVLWKNISWSICDKEVTSKWDRAVIGACCGHRKALLDVANSWEDYLWAYLKCSLNAKIEKRLATLNKKAKPSNLPAEFWDQALNIDRILDDLESGKKKEMNIENMFQFLQKCVMRNDLNLFIEELLANIDTLMNGVEHPLILEHLIRFLTNALLAFAIVDLCYNEQLLNLTCDAYVNVLVKNGLFVATPFYVQKVSFDLQISVVVSQINPETHYAVEEIRDFLQGAAMNSLDVLGIAVAIVDKLRNEVTTFEVEMLRWISECYDLVEDRPAVMSEYLRFTVWICRKYLLIGDLERVKRLLAEVTPECIRYTTKSCPNLVREFVCYREYLEAEDILSLWKQAMAQRPIQDDFSDLSLEAAGSMSDRALYEIKRKEFASNEAKWRKAVDFHGKNAIDAFMKILKFPDGGWLRNCCNEEDEEEAVHISALRRVILKKVTFLVLNLVKERGIADDYRAFVAVLCDNRRRILEEFTRTEIGSIFKVISEFCKQSSDLNGLPK